MFDFPFQAQLAIATAEWPCKLRLQSRETLDFLLHIRQLALEHGLHVGTRVMLLPQRQQFLDFALDQQALSTEQKKHLIELRMKLEALASDPES